MPIKKGSIRGEWSVMRDDLVHEEYERIIKGLGDARAGISRGWIYDRLADKFRLSVRTISYIINHTRHSRS